jgi:hypothetical protein
MKRVFVCVAFAGVLMLVPGIVGANGSPCSLEGTWYGYNTAGGDYIITIARTGAKSYSAWLVSGSGPAHGELVRQPTGGFQTTWMGYADGPAFGYPPGTKVMYYMYGEASMDGCDLWTAMTDWDIYLFNEGVQEDPFVDGVYQFSLPGIELTYKRMPMEFPAP